MSGYVYLGARFENGKWTALIKTVGPRGQIEHFQKVGYPTQDSALLDAREMVNQWMMNLNLSGFVSELPAED